MTTVGRNEIAMNNASSQNQMYRVLFKTGQERTMELSNEAVKYYQGIGVQVTPIASTTQLTDVSLRMRNIESNQMQIGKDLTALGKIDIRQDASIAGYRSEFDNAKIQFSESLLVEDSKYRFEFGLDFGYGMAIWLDDEYL